MWVHPLAAAVAIASKFVLRVNGNMLYNPANLGVMVALLLLPGASDLTGQWGSRRARGVVRRARRAGSKKARRWDISWMFLACFVGLVAARVAWLGQSPRRAPAPAAVRRAALVHLLHDLRPDDDPNRRRAASRLVYAAVWFGLLAACGWQYGNRGLTGPAIEISQRVARGRALGAGKAVWLRSGDKGQPGWTAPPLIVL